MNTKRVFLYTLIGSVALSAVIGIVVILFGNFGELETKILMTTLTITTTSILGLACGAYLETGQSKWLPIAGILFAVLSAVMWIVMIWLGEIRNDVYIKSLMSATLLAASCSHLSLLSLARLERRFLWSRHSVFAAVGALTALFLYFIWTNGDINEDLMGRASGVLGVIIAALTIITPVFHKLSANQTTIREIDDEISELKKRIEELETKRSELTQADPKT